MAHRWPQEQGDQPCVLGGSRLFRGPSSLRLAAQDVALSRRKQGFESPRERHGPALMTDPQTWPTELRLRKDRKTLTVTFTGGESFDLPAEYLRVKSPSAEVQGHSAEERKTVPGKRDVGLIEVLPVGNYAVRLVFDDMHSTGIFDWDYLLELGRNYSVYWRDYLDELAAKNLTREPPARRK